MRPIFVALDTPDVHRAAAIARELIGLAGGVKLGLEFFCANGRDGVLRIAEHGMPIFLDLKLHDIPNTVGKAVEAIAPLAPAILTVHAAGGKAMMAAAKAAAPPDDESRCGHGADQPRCERPARRSALPALQKIRSSALPSWLGEAGIDGIVCSGEEVGVGARYLAGGLFRRAWCSARRRRHRPIKSAS